VLATVPGAKRLQGNARGLAQPHTTMPVHYEGWQHFHQGSNEVDATFARSPDGVRTSLTWLPMGAATGIRA
jgi:hypothetical protein